MPPHKESASTVPPVSERDTRLLNAFLATAVLNLANDIAEGHADEGQVNPALVGAVFELMGVVECASGCLDPDCDRTSRVASWIAEAVAHVDRGEPLVAHAEIHDFMQDLAVEDPEDQCAPALLN